MGKKWTHHRWQAIGSAGDFADSTVYQCRDCGIHSTTNGTPDDTKYPPCKVIYEPAKKKPHKTAWDRVRGKEIL